MQQMNTTNNSPIAPIANNSDLVMVFDTETTGLLPKKPANASSTNVPLEEYPYITQMSFIVFDVKNYVVVHYYNAYIRIPSHIIISSEVEAITHITNEKLEMYGIDIKEALLELYKWYFKVKAVVAHNLYFDGKMVQTELRRHYKDMLYDTQEVIQLFNSAYAQYKNIVLYCTMLASHRACNIEILRNGTYYRKFPKLMELYEYLFGETPEDLHNSLVDSLVCLKCYLKFEHKIDIHPAKYRHMLKAVMKLK
jgi:DNA polymerase III epsilon subunit-like protein